LFYGWQHGSPAGHVFPVCSCSAQATAPRITAQLFGEEKKADIVGYQFSPVDAAARSDSALAVEIVTEAFKAQQDAVVDVLPRSNCHLRAVQQRCGGTDGSVQDLAAKEKSRYLVITFYLRALR